MTATTTSTLTTVSTATATTLATPDGPFSLVVSDGAVVASGWTDDVASLVALIHPSLRPSAGATVDLEALGDGVTSGPTLADAAKAVAAYYAGDASAIANVPVRQRSGAFREHAWEVLRTVTPGTPVTYTEYARRTGRPAAVRAAAGACAMNAAALFVPCHRVLRTDGTLGGFRYGLAIKQSLLQREAGTPSEIMAG